MTTSPDKHKGIVIVLSLLCALIGFGAVRFFLRTPSVEQQLTTAVNEINQNCPIMIDSETRLDNTMIDTGNDFQYNYTLVNFSKEEVDTNMLENHLKPVIIRSIKTKPEMRVFRDNGIDMIYNYRDKNGDFIMKLLIRPQDYR